MKKTVLVSIYFNEDGSESVDLKTNEVPYSLIIEHLKALQALLSKKMVEDARTVVSDSELEKYLDARIKVDRDILIKMLKQ